MKTRHHLCISLALLPLLFLGAALPALAHADATLTAANALHAWNYDLDIYIMTALVAAFYFNGAFQRRHARNAPALWRHGAFLAGLALVFLALESPVDPLAERAFWVHQIQHLLLRMTGPLLIMLAGPETTFMVGLPRFLKRLLVQPVAGNRAMQGLGRFLSRPIAVFLIFLLSLVIWEIPALHNGALLSPALHYLMHITMLLAGLIFFHAIFDRRLPPASMSFAWRQTMLLGTVLTTIFIGAVTAFKQAVWYTAYDLEGRLFVQTPLSDEQIGGFIIWVPGSMMLIVAVIVTIYAWNAEETRRFARRDGWISSNMAAMQQPQTAEELWIKVEKPNRALALGLGTISFSIFALLMSTMVINYVMR